MLLDTIHSPAELKALPAERIPELCADLREVILDAVSTHGGHLASNLGVVELTVALHRVFSVPTDAILFDVGHQCYAHKILTGRRAALEAGLRQTGGLSGFPNRSESDCDPMTTGHSGSSLSAAFGMAVANRLAGSDAWSVAVIGDGSFGNGMIYEALNACAEKGLRLLIVLNDNEMSISRNVGGMSNYFSRIRVSRRYFAFKRGTKRFFSHLPLIGRPLIGGAIAVKEFLKRVTNQKNVFEEFGLEYLGPVRAGDEAQLESVLREAMDCDRPCVVHVVTKKGSGYLYAEEEPDRYHSVPPFPLGSGLPKETKTTFSSVFGEELCALAADDPRICAVTAAMRDGTGLAPFAEKFPDRFFDAGIAEEHAVTFSAGLALRGLRPVTAIYSTFIQRAFDQVLEDAALQRVPLVLALDRCGVVPGDGPTHQGVFDIPLLSPIPGIVIDSPENYAELRECLRRAVSADSVTVIRYPRGAEAVYDRAVWHREGDVFTADFSTLSGNGPRIAILSYGREALAALRRAESLAAERPVRVIRPLRLFPLDADAILRALDGVTELTVMEESFARGGYGEALAAALSGKVTVRTVAFRDFLPQGDAPALLRSAGLE